MANDNAAHPMNGWEKRDLVADTLKTGDAAAANNVLNTVQDQKLFMDLLGSKAEGSSLPGLSITSDKAGHVHEIKTDKMTISDADGHLTAKSNSHGIGEYISTKWQGFKDGVNGAAESVKDYARSTDLGDGLATSGTNRSLTNRRIDAYVQQAEGAPKEEVLKTLKGQ